MKHSIIFLASLLVTSASIVTANPNIAADATEKNTSFISIKNKARIAKWTTTAACAAASLFLINRYKIKLNYDLANPLANSDFVAVKKYREWNDKNLAMINRIITETGVGTSIIISSALLDEKTTSPLTSATAGAAVCIFSSITHDNELPTIGRIIRYSVSAFAGGLLGTAATKLGNYAERKVVDYYTPENNTDN